MKIYLAGPITGRPFNEIFDEWDNRTKELQKMGYEVFSPLTGKDYLRQHPGQAQAEESAKTYVGPITSNHSIFHRDRWMVEYVDVVLADLSSATRVSIGTMFELAWASLLRKNVIVILPKDNPHNHAFVKEAATTVFEESSTAIEYLGTLI